MTASCSCELSSPNDLRKALAVSMLGLGPKLIIASRNEEAVPSCRLLAILNDGCP